ncbi:Rap1a/Tai family immunity protein [uncultured Thiodictyon sp.]|uniref:Rap1a/Tai family immunity protein n=1 Tax=uncultured Thiodictyon sp. TaxID=1846217 RepID=UPI0025E617D2|nr:Rap1a/Tai family immunity protein [uncultured Thiodictyon sp.]
MMVFTPLSPRSRVISGVAVLLSLGLCQRAAAVDNADFRFDTTKDLIAVCAVAATEPEYPVAHQACRAFIEAAGEYHDLVSKPGKLPRLVCYPPTATIEDGVGAFSNWAAAHAGDSKLLGEPPVVGLMRALAAKYPCKG